MIKVDGVEKDWLPLYEPTGMVVGHLAEPTPIELLSIGDVVWDDRNDQPCIFDGKDIHDSSYWLYWGPRDYFCGSPGSRWRHVVTYGEG